MGDVETSAAKPTRPPPYLLASAVYWFVALSVLPRLMVERAHLRARSASGRRLARTRLGIELSPLPQRNSSAAHTIP